MQPLPSRRNRKKPFISSLPKDIRQNTQIKTLQQEETKSWYSQKKYGTSSTHRLGMSYNPIRNDLSETHRDTSLETGQRPQLSTSRSWQTLKGTKWRLNKSSQVDTTTQTNSGLWVDQQPRYSKVSVPTWKPETKKHSSKLWKRSIFSFATSQEIDREAKELTLTALRLPQHAKHMEDQHVEDDTKRMVFSNQDVEKIHQARYESSILRNATSNQPRGFSNGWGNRGRGFGNKFSQKPFFGRGRGRGFFNPPTTNNDSNNQNFSTSTNNNNQ
ncbi:hypothetical protein G6F35_006157 [Rhizopus arrhizus]|nr:hypothetical protein G6F24_011067 [Rhizopus arrhizus]KAG0787654.1 hypothetical protein G6F21_007757 [Rhizopus arrhizus]KAG0958934.1 hypothetical protein G6F31_012157 [Rhizopus arrhizus]KAG1107521.1 hypothetical protein G6F40_009910 [Rhizopus arrhizus]KAG1221204.1 hypothetical protein G6F35_006157 [Rhizopus arrhizus]